MNALSELKRLKDAFDEEQVNIIIEIMENQNILLGDILNCELRRIEDNRKLNSQCANLGMSIGDLRIDLDESNRKHDKLDVIFRTLFVLNVLLIILCTIIVFWKFA